MSAFALYGGMAVIVWCISLFYIDDSELLPLAILVTVFWPLLLPVILISLFCVASWNGVQVIKKKFRRMK